MFCQKYQCLCYLILYLFTLCCTSLKDDNTLITNQARGCFEEEYLKELIYLYVHFTALNNLKAFILTITELSEESWEILCDCFTEVIYQKGDWLLREGQVCKSVFYINEGFCKSFYIHEGKAINTAFYFENEFATNVKSLINASPSDYFIQACEHLKAAKLDKARLLDAYKKSPQIETFGRKVLELMIAKQEEHADSFKILTPKERYALLLARQPDFLQRVSLSQTASYLGISRETLSRLRAKK